MKYLIDYAMTFSGKPYIWGGDTPLAGFDCSGLVQEILDSVGIKPMGDNTANDLYQYFYSNGAISKARAGALAFFGPTSSDIIHVGFMLDEYRMLEAAGGDHTCTTFEAAKKKRAFIKVRPVSHRKDLITIIFPRYPLWIKEDV